MNVLLTLIEKFLVGIFALGFVALIVIGVIRYRGEGAEAGGGSWAQVRKHNTLEGYLEFLHECPSCRHAEEAEAALDGLQRARGLLARLERGQMHERAAIGLPAFSPDGRMLAAVGGAEPGVWDAAGGTRQPVGDQAFRVPGGQRVEALAYAPDGRRIAAGLSGAEQGGLLVWDGHDGKLLAEHPIEDYDAQAVAFAPQGTLLGWLAHGPVGVWDFTTGKFLRATHEGATALAFTRDASGRLLLLSAAGRELWFWEPAGMEPVRQASIASDRALLGLSQDGRWIAYAEGPVLELWDTRTTALVATLAGHDGEVLSFCREPKKAWVAVGTREGSLYLWNPAAPAPLARIAAHEGPVEQLACSVPGRVVTVGWDGAKVWDMDKLRKTQPAAAPKTEGGEGQE